MRTVRPYRVGDSTVVSVPARVARYWKQTGVTHLAVAWDGVHLVLWPVRPDEDLPEPAKVAIRRLHKGWQTTHE